MTFQGLCMHYPLAQCGPTYTPQSSVWYTTHYNTHSNYKREGVCIHTQHIHLHVYNKHKINTNYTTQLVNKPHIIVSNCNVQKLSLCSHGNLYLTPDCYPRPPPSSLWSTEHIRHGHNLLQIVWDWQAIVLHVHMQLLRPAIDILCSGWLCMTIPFSQGVAIHTRVCEMNLHSASCHLTPSVSEKPRHWIIHLMLHAW